jgi:hypothetical protein
VDAASPIAGAAAPPVNDASVLTRWISRPATEPRVTTGRLVAFAVLVLVTALNIAAHPMWFDELQAWNVARTADSLGDVAEHLHYEGHPIGWYLPLFALSRVTGNPAAMQVLQGAIAAGVFWMLLFRAPFRTSVSVMLAAGYIFGFEYAVISRPYGLCALLFLLALDALARPVPRRLVAGVWLVALVFVHQLGAVLALALVLTEAWRVYHGRARERDPEAFRRMFVFGGVVVAAVVLMLVSIAPAEDAGRSGFFGGRFEADGVKRVALALAAPAKGLAPLPRHLAWNDLVWEHLPLGLTVVVAGLIGAGALFLFRREPAAAVLWVVGTFGLVVFFVVGYRPVVVRHSGFFLLLLVGCCWYAVAARTPGAGVVFPDARAAERIALAGLVAVLVAQVLAGVVLAVHFAATPFRESREQADAIREAGLEDRVVSGDDVTATPIAGYLDRDYYSVALGEEARYITYREGARREILAVADDDHDRSLAVARAVAACEARPVAVVLSPSAPPIPELEELAPAVYEVPPGPLPDDCPP